ncbi:dihydroxyacetone kinase phosphoryl donor subunit DhaM [Microbacterium sp. P05]|uniref:dihydroxyacetone kinase phosphoryl donor subunit DhaM n=1 Tax=Microbacterium sp. P05 TaxID=3366948 RepID=UPI003747162E
MIGIVVVSHSRALAEAAVHLALQMGGATPPPVEIAAGIAEGGFGTDAVAIAAAVDRLDAAEGVLVIMDLGSALLSAEMALDFAASTTEVVLSPAPFVEGLVAAVVLASTGADLATVASEARGALAAKQTQLAESAPAAAPSEAAADAQGAASLSFDAVIRNPSGLHARPAALFVKAASRHDAEIDIVDLDHGGEAASARSLISLMALGIRPGTRVRVQARGPEAQAAIDELRVLVEDGFGEE